MVINKGKGAGSGGRRIEKSRIHIVPRNKKIALESASVITVQQRFTEHKELNLPFS